MCYIVIESQSSREGYEYCGVRKPTRSSRGTFGITNEIVRIQEIEAKLNGLGRLSLNYKALSRSLIFDDSACK